MKATNNFTQIKSLLKFEDLKDFYFVQLIIRKKEDPTLGSNNKVIKTYYVSSLEYFESKEKEIIAQCDYHMARAYIHLNRRNYDDLALDMLEQLVKQIRSKQTDSLSRLFDSVAGTAHSKKDKTWIVDIDWEKDENNNNLIDWLKVGEIEMFIESLQPIQVEFKTIARIPTRNGVHLITTPFNSKEFGDKYSYDLHKNNPTLLYCV